MREDQSHKHVSIVLNEKEVGMLSELLERHHMPSYSDVLRAALRQMYYKLQKEKHKIICTIEMWPCIACKREVAEVDETTFLDAIHRRQVIICNRCQVEYFKQFEQQDSEEKEKHHE